MNGFSLAQWRKAAKVKMVSFAFFAASREIPKVLDRSRHGSQPGDPL